MDQRPIGFFDSGLGGASVLREALRMLPDENYIYYGDDANAPYGDRDFASIRALTLRCADELCSLGIKALVLACNTATATCIDDVRAALPIPVVSVEPAIKPACETAGDGTILMLATAATTRLERYKRLLERMPDAGRIISVPCPGLVERIESGHVQPGDFDDILDERLAFMRGKKVAAIVLGCTHYVFISKAIYEYARARFDGECRMYDGNAATVRQLKRVLEANALENGCGNARIDYITSGDRERLEPLFRTLISC